MNRTPNTEACDKCESCMSFNSSRSYNIHELDAASNNSIEDIRSLIDKVRILPQVGKYSIYIIDEVHMLSASAFNAFLKTLEEPPSHAIFILATTEKHKIIPTILSRCQIFDFQRIRLADISGYLAKVAAAEHILFEEEALNVIALKADGAMRDALSIFDQVASFSNRNITYQEVLDNLNVLDYEYYFRMTSCFLSASADKSLLLFNEILQKGFDGQNFIGGLASHLRDLLVSRDESTLSLLEVGDILRKRYKEQSQLCTNEFLYAALEICSQCELNFRSARNQRLHVELALIRLSNLTAEKKNLSDENDAVILPEITMPSADKSSSQVIQTVPRPRTDTTGKSSLEKAPPVASTGVSPGSANSTPLSISIKDALGQAKAKEPVISDEEDTEPDTEDPAQTQLINKQEVTPALLAISWNAFADKIRDNRPRMAVSLKSVKPQIEDNHVIKVELNNRSQLDDFNSTTRSELEKFLRFEMHNPSIHIEAILMETDEDQQIKLYTSEEKFRYLSKKNPGLESFRQKLNLELE